MAQEGTSPANEKVEDAEPLQEQIAALAYALWEQRGRVEGNPEQDWFQAEEQLKSDKPAV
ncbi:MAG TPA: DUF2934 domain-containing protein [Bryobacteraceae bacterium]|nr:DUF2934 domain-containing protein [Bryobacteraceae bacterium]